MEGITEFKGPVTSEPETPRPVKIGSKELISFQVLGRDLRLQYTMSKPELYWINRGRRYSEVPPFVFDFAIGGGGGGDIGTEIKIDGLLEDVRGGGNFSAFDPHGLYEIIIRRLK